MNDRDDMLRTLYRFSPTAVIVTNMQRELTAINPAAERLFGNTELEVAGRSVQGFYADPRDFDRLGVTHFNPASLENSRCYTVRYRAKTGRVFDGETIASPVISSSGEHTGYVCIIRDVTAELALQAKLEASDVQLRVALSSANEGTFSLNLASGLGSTRGFINEFLGIRSNDATISLIRWIDAIHEHDRPGFRNALDALNKNPATKLDSIYRTRRADGEWRWLQTRGRVSEFGREGEPVRISGTVADVTERRELEIRLAKREQQLANAIAAGSVGVWEIDPEIPGILAVGPIREMLGLPEQPEIIDRDFWLAGIHPDDRDAVIGVTSRLMNGEADAIDVEYRRRDIRSGKWVWLRSAGQLVQHSDRTQTMAGVLTDISEQKKLEDRLARSERLVREALESVRDGAWSVDLERETIRVSGFLAELTRRGRPSEEIPIQTWLNERQAEDRDLGAQRLAALRAAPATDAGVVDASEFRVLDRNGEVIWVRSRGRVIEWSEDGKPLRAAGTHTDITEEKRLQAELADRDLQFRDALQATNEGAWRLNLQTRMCDISGVLSEMLGLPPGDARVAVDELIERFDAAGKETAKRSLMALVSDQSQSCDFTARLRSEKDGWISIHNRGRITGRDPSGRPIVATGFMSNISGRLETEQRLKEREQQLKDAIQATALGIFRIDTGTSEVWVRGRIVEELFGQADEIRVSAQTWLDRVHPEDLDAVTGLTRAMFRGDMTVGDIVYRMKSGTGAWVWYEVTGRVVERDATGRVLNVSGCVWNIDAQKRLNDALLEERQRFEKIYRATPAMTHTIDADGTIREVSDYWLTHMGYSREEVIGRKSTDFLDAKSRQYALETSLPNLFKTGRNTDIPYRFVRKDGTKLDMLLSSFLERDEAGNPLRSYAVMTDVTSLRAAYAQLERSNQELDRFATVASHDLQEPLRKVAAFASLVRRRYAEHIDEDGIRSLDFLVDAAQRMQHLIDDLLAYSRMGSQPIQLQPVDLNVLTKEVLGQLETSIAECGARLEIGVLPTVHADPLLMRQVLQNLVGNAVKYRGSALPVIEIAARCDEDAWTITVADNGIGIDPKFFEKIFAPFQRLHSREAYGGTGIGLAIVRQAIERHDGRIWVESAEGKGAKFHFSIPMGTARTDETSFDTA